MNTTSTVDINAYLSHAMVLSDQEVALRKKICDWLPTNIVDCHSHAHLPEHVVSISEFAFGHVMSTFPSFTLEQSRQFNALLHPGINVRSLRFAGVFHGIDFPAANTYLLECSPPEDRVALLGMPDDIEYTVQALAHPRVSALKMYYASCNPPARTIYGYFPPEILEEAQARNIPIILHPPRVVTQCMDQLQILRRDFPRLRIVIAHLGLTKMVVPGLRAAYEELAAVPTIFMDTSMVPSAAVVALALDTFGSQRIMFGSDAPINLIRSAAYVHPQKGQRVVTDYPYHWVDSEEYSQYGHLARNAVQAHWQSLEALYEAVQALPVRERENAKQALFCQAASVIFRF